MEILKEMLLSITVISIFSVIILTIIKEDNSQREIAKIGCGCLMIIAILSPLKSGSYFSDISYLYNDYKNIDTKEIKANIENKVIKAKLEEYVLNELGIYVEITLNDDYSIKKVKTKEKVSEIIKILGITEEQIEYIESR